MCLIVHLPKSKFKKEKHPLISLLTFAILNLNNTKFNDYIDVLYPEDLENKDTTYAPKWTNYIDLRLEFDEDGKLYTRHYDKRVDFDFPIVNLSYLSSNIPESPA